ncbi:MAG: GFA family protein [Rhodospirillales bacterium]|nr:GFA family protein [Rhodospirillales bacterium]
MKEVFSGGCLCGAVRYQSSEDPQFAGHCHCEDCRRSSGSGHCSHLGVNESAFSVSGETRAYDRATDKGNMVSRVFCPVCGAPVYSLNPGFPGLVFVRASSLDDPEVFKPQMIVYASRAPSWDHMDASLPSFAENPPFEPET